MVYHRVAFKRCVNGLNGRLGEQCLYLYLLIRGELAKTVLLRIVELHEIYNFALESFSNLPWFSKCKASKYGT